MASLEQLTHPEPAEEEERRTSYLELFFDLVFVFAITQVTTLLVGDTSAGGFARSALVLVLVWWAWGGYAWMTNAVDIENPRSGRLHGSASRGVSLCSWPSRSLMVSTQLHFLRSSWAS